jgi:hypothetical protein
LLTAAANPDASGNLFDAQAMMIASPEDTRYASWASFFIDIQTMVCQERPWRNPSMFNRILFVFVLLVLMTFIARRLFSRKRGKRGQGGSLDAYIRRHEAEVNSQIESMRLETHRFGAHEALAPVEAGLRELLDLHGNPEDIALLREGDALILQAPDIRITVAWNFQAANRTAPSRSRHIYGKGQWELSVRNNPSEPYTQLDSLMGRLSPLVRALARHEDLEDFRDDAFFPPPWAKSKSGRSQS